MSTEEKRAAFTAELRRSLDFPEAGEVQAIDTDSIAAELAEMFGKIKVKTTDEMRAHHFETVIAPRLKDFGLDERYQHLDLLSGPDNRCRLQEGVLAGLKKMFRNCGAIVALVGPRGTGKTTIAAQLAADRLWEDWQIACSPERRGQPCRVTSYRKMGTLLARFKAYYGDFGTTQMDQMVASLDHLSSVECLVIDELHEVPDDSKHKDRLLTDLLDRRYAAKRDTLLISNQKKEEFVKSLNASALSRLNEHGGIVRCEWPSFRDHPTP